MTLVPTPGVPRVIDRKFRLEQRIGRGGMGSVYRARDVRLDRDVAIKVVRAELLSDDDRERRGRAYCAPARAESVHKCSVHPTATW